VVVNGVPVAPTSVNASIGAVTVEGALAVGTGATTTIEVFGRSLADVTDIGDTGAGPDGQLTVDDIIAFVNTFSDGINCPGSAPCNRADVTGIGGLPSGPDGQLTVDDIIEFVNAFSDGCQ
jgi:hypothetical protein